MQQPGPMFPVMPSFPPTNITTEQIQKYLDQNKKLILAILDNQNLGKLTECAQYQAQLQKNLMYLAAVADAQPQTPAVPAQMTVHPHPAMHQGGFYMQHPQAAAAAMTQQPGLFPPRAPFSSLHPLQDPHMQLQQQQQHQTQAHTQTATHGQISAAMRSVGQPNSIIDSSHANDTNLGGGGSSSVPTPSNAICGGNKQDKPDVSSDGQGNSAVGHAGGDAEQQTK